MRSDVLNKTSGQEIIVFKWSLHTSGSDSVNIRSGAHFVHMSTLTLVTIGSRDNVLLPRGSTDRHDPGGRFLGSTKLT